jgi:hypothetical protein
MFSSLYCNNNETYYSTIIVMIPTQRTKIIAVRGIVSLYYCKLNLAPIFRPVNRINLELVPRRKISAIGGLSFQAAGFMNFVPGIDDVTL